MNLKSSERTLLCLGVNSGRFMGLAAFKSPLFSDRETVRIDIGLEVNVGFAGASRLRYLFSRLSVLRDLLERWRSDAVPSAR